MNQQVVAAFLFSLSLGLPCYAAAGVSAVEAEPLTKHEAWVERIATAQQAMDDANARYENAVRAYSHMRHRRSERGQRKADVLIEQENARAEVAEAARFLDTTLEQARRDGVPPGWVREALAGSTSPAAQTH